MQFYNNMLIDFQKNVVLSQSPREIAYRKSITLLEEIKNIGGITLDDLFTRICQGNELLSKYFGYDENKGSLKVRDNMKVSNVYDMLLNNSKIKKIQDKPVVLQWLCDTCDPFDTPREEKIIQEFTEIDNNENNLQSETGSHTSHTEVQEEETVMTIQFGKGPIQFGPDKEKKKNAGAIK